MHVGGDDPSFSKKKRNQMYLRMNKTEERRRHGGANRISLGGAQQGFKYSRCERAKRKRERQKGTRERESERSRLISSLFAERDTSTKLRERQKTRLAKRNVVEDSIPNGNVDQNVRHRYHQTTWQFLDCVLLIVRNQNPPGEIIPVQVVERETNNQTSVSVERETNNQEPSMGKLKPHNVKEEPSHQPLSNMDGWLPVRPVLPLFFTFNTFLRQVILSVPEVLEIMANLSMRKRFEGSSGHSMQDLFSMPPPIPFPPNMKVPPVDPPVFSQQEELPPPLGLDQFSTALSSIPEKHRKVLENIIHGYGNWETILRDPRLKFSKFKSQEYLAARWEEEQRKFLDSLSSLPSKSSRTASLPLFEPSYNHLGLRSEPFPPPGDPSAGPSNTLSDKPFPLNSLGMGNLDMQLPPMLDSSNNVLFLGRSTNPSLVDPNRVLNLHNQMGKDVLGGCSSSSENKLPHWLRDAVNSNDTCEADQLRIHLDDKPMDVEQESENASNKQCEPTEADTPNMDAEQLH
uniref:Myb-like domain-containing protein n=1 Tax=Brassica oleracea var. oleracea TaxID=109376 RepID=A0A0D3AEX8_BRAOL